VTFTNAAVCEPVIITYHPNMGVLKDAEQIYAHIGFDGWSNMVDPDVAMSKSTANGWQYSIVPPDGAAQIDLVFNDGGSIWDNNDSEDWDFTVTGCGQGTVPPGIIITNPGQESITITSATSVITLRGTAGTDLTGNLSWTNDQTGGSGTLSNALHWSITDIPLDPGSNTIIISGPTTSGSTTNAHDHASDSAYSDSWISGDNGGSGWGSGWDLVGAENAGHFIATSSEGNLDIADPAFGLYANNDAMSEAIRPLLTPLASGQTVQISFENNFIDTGKSVGFALMNNSNSLFEFYFYGGDSTYRITDSTGNRDTLLPYTSSGLVVAVTLTGPSTYSTTIGGSNYTGTLITQADTQIRRIRFWNYSAGVGSDHNAYFNNLYVTSDNSGDQTSDSLIITLINPENYMPEWWQTEHFGCSTCAVGNVDSDGDGFSNQREYWLGTDPTNILSTFEINEVDGSSTEYNTIQWISIGGKAYDVQYTDELLNSPFETITTVTENSAPNGIMTNRMFQDTITEPSTNGFRVYRIQLHQ